MSCTRFRTAISARLDGEDLGAVDPGQLDAHLDGCVDCRAFAAEARRLHRATRLAPAPEVSDLTPTILAAIAADRSAAAADVPDDQSFVGALRIVLVALGIIQIAVALPALVLGEDAQLPVHIARHLGSFDVALGVGFLFAAWKPQRIAGILPFVTALVLCLVGSTLFDMIAGTTGTGTEMHHVTDVAGLVVLWLLSRAPVVRDGSRDAMPGGQVRLA